MSPKTKHIPKKHPAIKLIQGIGADPGLLVVNRMDQLRWKNETDRGVTLTFGVWPFVEPPGTIVITAGMQSRWYTIYGTTAVRSYSYTTDPTLLPPGVPPGEPEVVVAG